LSGTLIVWKAPLVEDEKAAARLLREYYASGDESAFEASADLERFYDELIGLWPPRGHEEDDDDDVPTWASGEPEASSRLVSMDYSWSAPDAMLDDIQRLAKKHELVLYDPQGPDVHLPTDAPDEPYVPTAGEIVRVASIGIVAVGAAIGAWYASIPVVSWIVIVVAGFMALMAALGLVADARQALERRRSA
jgi:hypothetical protein